MAGVFGVSCTMVKGVGETLRERVEAWQVPGIDGYGAQTLGKGNARVAFEAVNYDTAANVETWADAIRALAGTVGTIVDDWGESHVNILIERVGRLVKNPAQLPGGTLEAIGRLVIEGVRIKT